VIYLYGNFEFNYLLFLPGYFLVYRKLPVNRCEHRSYLQPDLRMESSTGGLACNSGLEHMPGFHSDTKN
jgi:hypothetical protein